MTKTVKFVYLTLVLLASQAPLFAQGQESPRAEAPQASSQNRPSGESPAQQKAETPPATPNTVKPEAPAASDQSTPPPLQGQSSPNTQSPAPPPPPNAQSKPKTTDTSSSKKKASASRKNASATKTHHATKPSDGQPGKIVVRNGGAKDESVQLSPGLSQEQQVHNRENTDELLTTTDDNLKRVASRQLTSSQQSTVDQIRAYMRQAKSAADAGDLARAHTLAFKAHLLSDDLTKR